ncbi:hypothetical protein GGF43_005248, partial [Coemansia sp. RSA 2618]
MSETKQLQASSFPPPVLAREISLRFDRGSAELGQFIEHYSKRAQLEDSLATTIEKSAGSSKHGTQRGANGPAEPNAGDVSGLVPILHGELEMRARMHVHLSERITNEVVQPLRLFTRHETWLTALEIRNKVQQMADEMRGHHEQIPKLSARATSKTPRTASQLHERLEDEKRKLFGLQQLWQTEVFGLVSDFEAADVARLEAIRESVLKFQHYQTEFFRAAQAQTGASREAAKHV